MNSSLSKNATIVCIQQNTYEDLDVKSLLKALGGMSEFVSDGDRVILKTNLLNATEPEKAVVTSPLFIKAVAKSVKDNGGIPIIADSPSGPFSKRRLKKVYQKTGLLSLSNYLGIELNYDTGHKKIPIPNGKRLKNTRICNFMHEADTIIALPKIKTHTFMMLTLASKIMFGSVPGLLKARYHSQYFRRPDFADMLLDILSVAPPHLILMDGIIGMHGEGPMSGDPIELGVVLASENAIAMDLSICNMLNIEPLGIPILKQAKIRKLWPHHITYPLLDPADVSRKDFVLPSTAGYLLTDENKPNKYPVMNDNCVACGDCVRICPRKVIHIENKRAQVNYSHCIQCYCCHEVCTYNAINLDKIHMKKS